MSKKPIQAARISVGACDCPSLHIMLHDRDGNVFAVACMPLETGWNFVDDVVTTLQEARAGKTVGQVPVH